MVVDNKGRGIPVAYVIFSAKADTSERGVHGDYSKALLEFILDRLVNAMGYNAAGEKFGPAVGITDNDAWKNALNCSLAGVPMGEDRASVRKRVGAFAIKLLREIVDYSEAKAAFDAEEEHFRVLGNSRTPLKRKISAAGLKFLKYLSPYLRSQELWLQWSRAGVIEAAKILGIPEDKVIPNFFFRRNNTVLLQQHCAWLRTAPKARHVSALPLDQDPNPGLALPDDQLLDNICDDPPQDAPMCVDLSEPDKPEELPGLSLSSTGTPPPSDDSWMADADVALDSFQICAILSALSADLPLSDSDPNSPTSGSSPHSPPTSSALSTPPSAHLSGLHPSEQNASLDSSPHNQRAILLQELLQASDICADLIRRLHGLGTDPEILTPHTPDSGVSELERFKSFSGVKFQKFNTFLEALLFMIDKEPYNSAGQALSTTPSQKIEPGVPAVHHPAHIGLQYPGAGNMGTAPNDTAFYPAALIYSTAPAHRVTAVYGTPLRAPASAAPGGTRHNESISTAAPLLRFTAGSGSSYGSSSTAHNTAPTVVKSEPADEEVERISHFMQMMFSGLPDNTRALRSLVGPLPSQDPRAAGTAPLMFGQRANELIRAWQLPPSSYIIILQAHLYSVNGRAFGYTLRRELGWPVEDGEELWSYLELPGM
ncbi:hypothetical protein C8Q80DRAFT_1269724 [Daedaleopsis nitida]|nr:hypothetical protein C8Q80DRAFT_1269724 [Daedaleopsis nitida]